MPSAASAAQRLTLRLGPIEQAIAIADLEQFAKTGELPPKLQILAPVLTPQAREVLNRRLQLDPKIADKVIEQVLRSPVGEQLVKSMGGVIPDSNIDLLQAAAGLAVRQANGLSVVGFLRAYPQEDITIDVSNAVAVALQFNPSYWESQALSPLLESELAVTSNTASLPTFDPAAAGNQTVQQQTLFLQDRQRHRTIPVDLYRSPNPQSPLVLISHGFGANRKAFAYLARHLASHGLTVAALEHPSSNINWLASIVDSSKPSGLLPAREFVDRPKDVSFVLDELGKLNQQPGLFQGKISTQQVSVIGHSLGGYTALALAGAELNLQELRQYCKSNIPIGRAPADWIQCAATDLVNPKLQLRDKRVVQVIALNPLVGNLFGKTGMSQIAIPVLMLAGTEDAVTPILNHQLRPFSQLRSSKYLLTAIGGTHLSVGDPTGLGANARNSTLSKERRGAETKSLRTLVQGVSLAFIEQLTPEAKTYEPFLTPAYAQTLSTSELPLRLNTELPAGIDPLVERLSRASATLQTSRISSTSWTRRMSAPPAIAAQQAAAVPHTRAFGSG